MRFYVVTASRKIPGHRGPVRMFVAKLFAADGTLVDAACAFEDGDDDYKAACNAAVQRLREESPYYYLERNGSPAA